MIDNSTKLDLTTDAPLAGMQCYAPLIFQGDCLIKLKELESNSIDAVITDPPYCSGGFF